VFEVTAGAATGVGSGIIFPYFLMEIKPPRLAILVLERAAISSGDIIVNETGYKSPIGRLANGVVTAV
jgi:hypothetical protein